jgi:hypothetical protein
MTKKSDSADGQEEEQQSQNVDDSLIDPTSGSSEQEENQNGENTTTDSSSDDLKEEPPGSVKKEAEQFREEDIRCIVERTDIFPPQLLSIASNAAVERRRHLLWVLRYRLAHPEAGLKAFDSCRGKRQSSCKWAAWETDTSYSQILQEIATVYEPDESPKYTFTEHLEEFVDRFKKKQSYC